MSQEPVILKFNTNLCPRCSGRLCASLTIVFVLNEDGRLVTDNGRDEMVNEADWFCEFGCEIDRKKLKGLNATLTKQFHSMFVEFSRQQLVGESDGFPVK